MYFYRFATASQPSTAISTTCERPYQTIVTIIRYRFSYERFNVYCFCHRSAPYHALTI